LIEFALVLPVLMAFLLGTITIGIAYNRSISMNNSTRETARYGALLPVDSDLSAWLNTVADVAIAGATGDLGPSVDGQYICVAYVYPDGTETEDRTSRLEETLGTRVETVGSTCFSDGRPNSERRVQLVLRRRTDLEAVVYSQTITLSSESVARFERSTG